MIDKEKISSVLSSPISFVREASGEERQIFSDKKSPWLYVFGLESEQQFIGCIFNGEEELINFRPIPKHNLLPELKEILWGYDNETYFGPGPSERRLIKVIVTENTSLETQKVYEECLGANAKDTVLRYGGYTISFLHPLREKALELKKYLRGQENSLSKIEKLKQEIKKSQEELQWARKGLREILTSKKDNEFSRILRKKWEERQQNDKSN